MNLSLKMSLNLKIFGGLKNIFYSGRPVTFQILLTVLISLCNLHGQFFAVLGNTCVVMVLQQL